ncbi:MAG TPA: amidohydrolase family protein [Vicinamibacteria bacterium]|nr:amidohydrolase family protein [Vicinamibacteria bacterium]
MKRRCLNHFALLLPAFWAAAVPASQDEEKPAEWDVSNPPGGVDSEISIDTDEGTWMNLDVSPDGQVIVFDLLGDLYELPIEGGEAKALTEGLAWDMQPRFSPDGQEIVFTSDRGGGDNIWIMNRDGSSPRAVTKEDFRLPNNPVWSPDGEFIAARKHFTSTRSLGAGEIWLYHRKGGGAGLQLNEKPNEQKDLGEPAFSPDGRFVYFSQDVTPGGVFEYSKDSNNRIYAIRRIDRETGDIDPVVEGFGGACRPTPSPDGRWLAFVRRERFQSKLFIHDLQSGENHLLYSSLDRDMQEIWAIHGVYANFAWTPDSGAIVFWAGGKIRRVDIGTGRVADIPFHVRQRHKMKRALRFENEPAPERFETRMLRWAQVSPQGDRVVFQALGHLYVKRLPEGTPQRLTRQSDHFEYYPSFSRDGSSVVYVSWDDEELGAVRVVSAEGGEGRKVTDAPGHYLEPALSPDGAFVVYRKAEGDYLRSLLWSKDPGLYVTPATGGEPRRIHKTGIAPHFGAEDQRVYFTVQEDWNKRFLRSIRLDGSEERTHVESEVATEFRVSPDGRRLAFAERFQAFYAPFVSASKPVKVGPKETAIPVTQVSSDAGEYLHWSGDGQRLYWSLGPTLFHRDVDAEESDEGAPLGFGVESDRPSGSVAFVGGRLITMDGDEVIEEGTVLVEGNRIVEVGPVGSVSVPEEAVRVDVRGATLMPGLIDVHWHGSQGTDEIQPEANWQNFASLAYGVTTAHDPSNDTSTFFAAAEMARAGLILAPRLFSTGTILYGAAGSFRAIVESEEDARAHLKRLKAAGAFSVKSYNQPRRDQRQMIVKAARDLGMLVVNEGGALFEHNMTMVADGHTGIEHSLSLGAIYDDVVQFWSQTEVANTPTLVVAYGGIAGERYWYQHTNVWEDEHLLTFVPREMIDAASRRRVMAPEEEYNHINTARIVKKLHDAGVGIQLGAHGQREGLGAHWELWMFEQGGMTPHEALRVATLEGARYLGMDQHLGSLKAGKLADLVVLENNPLENLKNSTSVRYVMVNGRLYEAATLDEIGNHPRKRPEFWWERRGSTLP